MATKTLSRLSRGVAALSGGDAQTWPFGAVRNWALSRSMWHAWGSQMPAALAKASVTLNNAHLANTATKDSFTFDPWLLTSGGPDNGRMPTRGDLSQIAYGADSRLESLIATADATHRNGARRLAGIAAAWFFGANPAGEAMYDPATGATYDGIAADGTINRNSGAESTIHGLLAMIALDQNPDIAALAQTASIDRRVGTTTLQAEDAQPSGDAVSVQLDSLWTGESLFGGSGYEAIGAGGSVTFSLGSHRPSLVLPVFDLRHRSSAVTTFLADDDAIGTVSSGDIGARGDSPAPGALLPVTLDVAVSSGVSELSATTTATTAGDTARLDAVMLQPLISRLVLTGDNHGTALLSSAADQPRRTQVALAGTGTARIESYDGNGKLVDVEFSSAPMVAVTVPAGGFTFVRR